MNKNKGQTVGTLESICTVQWSQSRRIGARDSDQKAQIFTDWSKRMSIRNFKVKIWKYSFVVHFMLCRLIRFFKYKRFYSYHLFFKTINIHWWFGLWIFELNEIVFFFGFLLYTLYTKIIEDDGEKLSYKASINYEFNV